MFSSLLNLVYPNLCSLCDEHLTKDEILICTDCYSSLPKTYFWRHELNPVERNMKGRVGVKHGSAFLFFNKNNKVQDILHLIKYHGMTNLAFLLGRYYGEELKKTGIFSDVDAIVPVPLHPRKELQRGFNQSLEISRGMSQEVAIPIWDKVLLRTSYTTSQTNKHREERWTNVQQTFKLQKGKTLTGKHVLIVDDVFTTGATLDACCQALRKGNPRELSVTTLAYADY